MKHEKILAFSIVSRHWDGTKYLGYISVHETDQFILHSYSAVTDANDARNQGVSTHIHQSDVIMSAVASQITCEENSPMSGEFPSQRANNE